MSFRENLVKLIQLVPQRYIVVLMTLIAMINTIAMRNILSITITQMVKPNPSIASASIDEYSCPMRDSERAINTTETDAEATLLTERYEWSEELQGWILGSFYIGYVIVQIPSGILAERFGGKYMLIVTQFSTALISVLTPWTMQAGGHVALIALQIIMGAFQAGLFPALAVIISTWVPRSERAFLSSVIFNGLGIGAIVGKFFSGILLHNYGSWHIVFYCFGTFGGIIAVLYALLASKTPHTHPFITEKEKNYLLQEIGQLQRDKNQPPTPWKSILLSRPVIASNLTGCLASWGYFVAMIDLPKYMNDVLRMNAHENGIYSSMPYVLYTIVSLAGSYVCDRIIANNLIGVTKARKLYEGMSALIEGSFILAAAYAGCDPMIVAAFLTMAIGAQGLQTSSNYLNPMDLSPNYAGTIYALTNACACCIGFLVPVIIGLLTPNSLASEWRTVFWITFFIDAFKILVFTIFGSAEIQPWNNPMPRSKRESHLNSNSDYGNSQINGENLKTCGN